MIKLKTWETCILYMQSDFSNRDQSNFALRQLAPSSNYLSFLHNSWLCWFHFYCNPILSQFPIITNPVKSITISWPDIIILTFLSLAFLNFPSPSFLPFMKFFHIRKMQPITDATHNLDIFFNKLHILHRNSPTDDKNQRHLATTVTRTTRF